MTGNLRVMGEVQETRPQCFKKHNLCQLQDGGMPTALRTIIILEEERLSVSHHGKENLGEIVGLL